MGIRKRGMDTLVNIIQNNPSIRRLCRPMLSNIKALDLVSQEQGELVTFHRRPRRTDVIRTWSDPNPIDEEVAIVVQGPLVIEEDFTLESVRLYRKHYPGSKIMVSTWRGEDSATIGRLEALGATVLLNDRPANSGPSNVNMQIVSSSNGVKAAMEMGANFILKSRSDQRFHAPNCLSFLVVMLRSFPAAGGGQKGRIVGISLDTFKYRPYGISDMFTFGYAEDMIKYWSPPLDPRANEDIVVTKDRCSIRDVSLLRLGEIYFASTYLESLGRKLEWTLKDSWQAYADYFLIIDKEAVDLYWNKYLKSREYRYLNYDAIRTDQELTFREWILLHNGMYVGDVPEHALDARFAEPIIPR